MPSSTRGEGVGTAAGQTCFSSTLLKDFLQQVRTGTGPRGLSQGRVRAAESDRQGPGLRRLSQGRARAAGSQPTLAL